MGAPSVSEDSKKGAANASSERATAEFSFNSYLSQTPHFVLPFHLLNGHILIDGAVDGRRGKFMFDTGTEFAFFLNNRVLPLKRDQLIGRGHAASGQEIVLYRQTRPIGRIDLAGQVSFAQAPGVLHTDWQFLADAYGLSRFLGSVGHAFNQNYQFEIDYLAQTIAFHALNQSPEVLARSVDPAKVVRTFAFTPTGVGGKLPEVALRVGNETLTAFFDTGNAGSLTLTPQMRDQLLARGDLTLTPSEFAYGMHSPQVRARLNGAQYDGQALPELYPLSFTTGTSNRLGLGYHFLKDYISVWNYQARTLTLLRP
jgi:hypothetical protein